MSMDKVASSPTLPTSDGWPTEEPTLLTENETAALTLALGVGISVNATTGDVKERHTVGDLASLVSNTTPPATVPSSPEMPFHSAMFHQEVQPKALSAVKLLPLTEASESSSTDAESDAGDRSSPSSSNNKVASFWIGDDQGCTRDLPPPVSAQEGPPPNPPSQQQLRRVQISDQKTKTKTVEFVPPDGGYGWVVALSACFVNLWILGFIKSYGVFYMHLRNAFPDASAYHASWLPALLSTIGLIIAPVTGWLCRNFTSRKVSFVGGIFCFLGLLLGSQSSSMNQLILSVGVLTGLGAGLTTTPGILIVSLYFEKRRALASAICVSGNALGGFFMPPLVDYLIAEYGLKGTMLIIAAMQLHICAASMLYRPIHVHALVQEHERKMKQQIDLSECSAPVPECNNLLPNTPASPRVALPSPASAPTTPMARSHAIWNKIVRKRLNSTSTTVEEEELQRQVSFLRSSSMMNSIPDLTHYARSWSVAGERTSLGSRSSIRIAMSSKSSLSRLSIGASSKSSLSKLALVSESKHPPLIRLTSDGDQKIAKHPTLVRLASEEENSVLPKNISGNIRLSQPRVKQEVRTQLGRQSSCRRVQGRIMSAVKEQDTDSQHSDEVEDQNLIPGEDREKEEQPTEAKLEVAVTSEKVEKKKDEDDDDDHEEDEEEEEKEEEKDKGPGCCYAFMISCFDLSLFKNPLFLMMTVSVFFMASGAPHAIFFLPPYAESVNIPSSQIPTMLSISSIVDLVGRLGIGFISDLGLCRISDLYFVSALAAGIAVLLVPQMTTFSTLSTVLCLYGFGVGAWFVLIPTLLAKHHGATRLASSYGLVRLFHGLMNFISPQINGLLVDSTDSFMYCYYFMGTSMVISSVVLLMEPFLVVHMSNKEKEKKEMEQSTKNQV